MHDAYSMKRIMEGAGACVVPVARVEEPMSGNEELHRAYFGLK